MWRVMDHTEGKDEIRYAAVRMLVTSIQRCDWCLDVSDLRVDSIVETLGRDALTRDLNGA